ncbi:hypothetical protein [Rosenbergiella australiborealis]|uniref:hypothetical protein n=1 Tax=Rosenbergiella australiborealis TaxID=1544696 RepID=UPI001F4E6970|nr:hypothetical protein [Rosenbergiella australiborealis]
MKIIQWLISLFTKESKPMTEPLSTEAVSATDSVAVATPTTEATAGVKDLAKAFEFIKSGIIHLGEAAEGELIALAQKYL